LKVKRLVFGMLLPIVISFIITMRYSLNWVYQTTLFVLISSIIHFMFFRKYTMEKQKITQKKYIIYSLAIMLMGIIIILAKLIFDFEQIVLIFGIILLSSGIGLIVGKGVENIKNYIVKKIMKLTLESKVEN